MGTATTFIASVTLPRAPSSSFHSSSPVAANNAILKAKTTRKGMLKHRSSQSARMKKKSRERPKPPAIGERRAQRHRIVLSNTNAFEVVGMENWSKGNMADEENVGHVLGLDGALLDKLRDCQAFKTTQNWSLFRRPATLVRTETVKVGRDIEALNSEGQKTVRHLVVGEKASGKSILGLQAMSMAFMNDWLVLNVPQGELESVRFPASYVLQEQILTSHFAVSAQAFVNNTSSYAPLKQEDNDTKEQLYIQPHLTQALLTRALHSNEALLKTLKFNHEFPKHLPLKQGTATLKELVQLGASDHTFAWPAWQVFWREISQPGAKARPPVLLAVDDIDHWMGPSKYRSAEFEIIHAHQLTLVRQFLRLFFSGSEKKDQQAFANGGMILFSTTGSNTPAYPTFELLVNQLRARAAQGGDSSDFPLPAPYSKPDSRVLELSSGLDHVNLTDLKGLSVPESKGYMDYFVRSGLLKRNITESAIAEFRSLSGGGVVGELAKLGRRIRL
ncbi:Small ribosomal subunit protein mS29 [Exophiala dermatitidis]